MHIIIGINNCANTSTKDDVSRHCLANRAIDFAFRLSSIRSGTLIN